MKKFLRSVNNNLEKKITVINGDGDSVTYKSLLDMSASERLEYYLTAMNSCEEDINPEQLAMVRTSVKKMMLKQAFDYQNC